MSAASYVGLFLAAGVGLGTAALSEEQLKGAYEAGMRALQGVQKTNDEQLIKAATIAWQVDKGTTDIPSVEQLVADGYIEEKFLTREKVPEPEKL